MIPVALSAVVMMTSVVPLQAAPFVPAQVSTERASDVINVQQSWRDRNNRNYRRPGVRERRILRQRGYYRQGGNAYYNGHRGYRERRPGYRQHNGVWFPLGAFAAGAIIGGAIADRPVRYGGSHVGWCQNRYRSYRVSDNSYQPNSGPRRACNSPY
ncbi:BA14K family protein [Pararhizobium antarcticum]|uniref:Lectin-like protein BA14k n=1 Tax=Pararhizobium antarcticum TaxID=1798805 RepID=A0A657LQM1_9HYPH|nr:BA14K family protein [Pararhizobium antarcticum]OJF93991.1 hypothetical protein AX760_20890 [Pararhizobium antarcticum]OJF97515.1 hypothetical protein AX761_14320 [Rhizobium sp. 58]